MLRKLKDTLSSAASSAVAALGLSEIDPGKVEALRAMGFTADDAVSALRSTDGNVDRAAELLLSSSIPPSPQPQIPHQSSAINLSHHSRQQCQDPPGDDEETLRRVLQESYDIEQQRKQNLHHQVQTVALASSNHRTAAMRKAAEAAERREQNRLDKLRSKKPVSSTQQTQRPQSKSITKTSTLPSVSLKLAGLAEHHPDVKIIPKLQDKSKEEQVLRCVERLKPYPAAIDALYRALKAVYESQKEHDKNRNNNSSNNVHKYRTIDKTTAGYRRSIAPAPGGEALLIAMNYRPDQQPPRGTKLILDPYNVDLALLYLGVTALEQAKQSTEYIDAKRLIEFQKEVELIFTSANASAEEAIERSKYLSMCPAEPPEGRGSYVQIKFAAPSYDTNNDDSSDNNTISSNTKILKTMAAEITVPTLSASTSGLESTATSSESFVLRRRFDGDDTLQDVLNWVACTGGTAMLRKLQGSLTVNADSANNPEWTLYDLNQYPARPINCSRQHAKLNTLQYIGCWPSGKLEIRPTLPNTAVTSA